MKKIKDIIVGFGVLNAGAALIFILVTLAIAIVYAWIFPILAAVKWSPWWLLMEVPIIIMYVVIWKASKTKDELKHEEEITD